MAVEEKVLEALLKNGTMDEEEQKVRGIAQLAVDKGYRALTAAQQRVLEPFLSATCSGVVDPGGSHNNCNRILEGEQLAEAIEQSSYYDAALCEACRVDSDYYENQWERIQAE